MKFLKALGLAVLFALTLGVVTSRVMAQAAVRLFATLSANLPTGQGTPVTCTASGTGCFLDVSIAGGGGTFTDGITVEKDAIGTTPTDGLVLTNTTAAAAGAQQYSPRTCWTGQGWKTDATAASQEVKFCLQVEPVQGAAAPTGEWSLYSGIGGAALTRMARVTSGGTWDFSPTSNTGTISVTPTGILNWASRVAVAAPASGELNILNSGGSANSGLRAAHIVEANTATKSPAATENNEVYTNTGDADGSAITLPDDPAAGTTFHVAVTVAQTITITKNTGETLKFGASTCGTSLTSNTIGSFVTIIAATGGSGAIWVTAASTGTWVCNA